MNVPPDLKLHKKALTRWTNFYLAPHEVEIKDIESGYSDGITLLRILERLTGVNPARGKKIYEPVPPKPLTFAHRVANLHMSFMHMSALGLDLSKVTAANVASGLSGAVCELVWVMVFSFQIRPMLRIKTVSQPLAIENVCAQFARFLSGRIVDTGRRVETIPQDLHDGRVICHMLAKADEGCIDLTDMDSLTPEAAWQRALNSATARFGVRPLVPALDMAASSETLMLLWVAMLDMAMHEQLGDAYADLDKSNPELGARRRRAENSPDALPAEDPVIEPEPAPEPAPESSATPSTRRSDTEPTHLVMELQSQNKLLEIIVTELREELRVEQLRWNEVPRYEEVIEILHEKLTRSREDVAHAESELRGTFAERDEMYRKMSRLEEDAEDSQALRTRLEQRAGQLQKVAALSVVEKESVEKVLNAEIEQLKALLALEREVSQRERDGRDAERLRAERAIAELRQNGGNVPKDLGKTRPMLLKNNEKQASSANVLNLKAHVMSLEAALNQARQEAAKTEDDLRDLQTRLAYEKWKKPSEEELANVATRQATPPSGRLALLFTDVQGSTSLWEQDPETMAVALQVHNDVVRAAIASMNGYEVKTEGDSFMVAFSNAAAAVCTAMSIQMDLLHAEWPDKLLTYREAEVDHDDSGRLIYRGLRVRCGIHTGEPLMRPDPITGRADYFGPMVNLAARVESAGAGGQILISEEGWTDVRYDLDNLPPIDHQALGSLQLKGITGPTDMHQLLPTALRRRQFPPLKAKGAESDQTAEERIKELVEKNEALHRELDELSSQLKAANQDCGDIFSALQSSEATASDPAEVETAIAAMHRIMDTQVALQTRVSNALAETNERDKRINLLQTKLTEEHEHFADLVAEDRKNAETEIRENVAREMQLIKKQLATARKTEKRNVAQLRALSDEVRALQDENRRFANALKNLGQHVEPTPRIALDEHEAEFALAAEGSGEDIRSRDSRSPSPEPTALPPAPARERSGGLLPAINGDAARSALLAPVGVQWPVDAEPVNVVGSSMGVAPPLRQRRRSSVDRLDMSAPTISLASPTAGQRSPTSSTGGGIGPGFMQSHAPRRPSVGTLPPVIMEGGEIASLRNSAPDFDTMHDDGGIPSQLAVPSGRGDPSRWRQRLDAGSPGGLPPVGPRVRGDSNPPSPQGFPQRPLSQQGRTTSTGTGAAPPRSLSAMGKTVSTGASPANTSPLLGARHL